MERPYLLDLEVTMEQANYLAGHTKRYDHANEERYGGAIEALDEAGKRRVKQRRWRRRGGSRGRIAKAQQNAQQRQQLEAAYQQTCGGYSGAIRVRAPRGR